MSSDDTALPDSNNSESSRRSQLRPTIIVVVAVVAIFALLSAGASGQIVPSQYARNARSAGLDIITWTLERSGLLADGNNGFYYQTFDSAIKTEGDMLRVLDVLARDVGVIGVFSDWPATTTFYANCANQR